MGNEWRTKTLVEAGCRTCGKLWSGPNAHGVAVQHARRYKHCTWVDRTITYVYDHDPDSEKEKP
jgi:hypothetical protein